MKKWYLIIIISFLLLIIGYVFFKTLQKIKKGINTYETHRGHLKDTIPKDYLDLYKPDVIAFITKGETYFYSIRNPVSSYLLYGNEYSVYQTKIELRAVMPLDMVVKENIESVKPSTQILYESFYQGLYDVQYRLEPIGPISTIVFSSEKRDHSIPIVKNDSMAAYFVDNGKFSLKYGKDSSVDFYTKQLDRFNSPKKIPMGVFFIRKGKTLHFLLVSLTSKVRDVKKDEFLKLVQGIII